MNQEKSIQDVYKYKNAKQLNFKLNAMDEGSNCLYLGDTNGKVYKYQLMRREVEFIPDGAQISRQITNSKIDLIKSLPFGKDILVLSSGSLLHIDGENLVTKQVIIPNGITNLVLNESNTSKNQVLVAFKNNKLSVLEFNINTHEFIQEKHQIPALPDTPLTLAFLETIIYYGTKKEYGCIDITKKLQPTPMNLLISPYPFIKVTDSNELFILVTNTNTGFLIGKDGSIKPCGTFDVLIKPIIQMCVQKPYLIILYDGCLQIFNMKDSKKMQETDFLSGGAKRLVASQGTIIFSTQQKISIFEEIPFEFRIRDCIKNCRIEEAMGIFYQSVSKDDPSFKDKQESIFLDAAWSLIEATRFREARSRFENREFDIRELLALFREFVPIALLDKVTINNNRTLNIIFGRISDKTRMEGLEKDAYEMLIDVLEKRRNKYNSPQFKTQENLNQKVVYIQSEYTPAKQTQEITLNEIMILIDFALIKIFIKRNNTQKLCDLFKGETPINCKANFKEIFQLLKESQIDQKDPSIVAFFFEKVDLIKEALDKWKDIGSMNAKCQNACQETIRILLSTEDSKRITDYLGWVIKKNLDIGKEFFKKVKESVISPEQMLTYISEGVYGKNEQGSIENLTEIYLEILVNDKKISESRFHTKLGCTYIDNLFKLLPKGEPRKEAKEKLNDLGQNLYKKFETFYQNPASNYDPSFLLEKVKKSWLVNEEIYFYGKSKKHRESLDLMISELKDYKMAEEYCTQHEDKTLTIMFKIYMENYNKICILSQKQEGAQHFAKLSEIISDWENRISIFLKKYGTHSQLDPFEVLKLVPDDWKLVEFLGNSNFSAQQVKQDDGLYSFLTQTISSSLHLRRQVSCAKQLSEMDLQNVKCNLINSKKAYVKITDDKKCAVCNKTIGDRSVCIYPNAVVAEQKCINNGQSQSICPYTQQDFEKTFRG